MPQMKEQNKTPGKKLSKMETTDLLDAELKTLVIRMLKVIRGRGDEPNENFNKRQEILKWKQKI